MTKPWAENPKTFSLKRRASGVPFSFRDPDGDGVDEFPAATLIFSENFDDQPDWTSAQIEAGAGDSYTEDAGKLPDGWTAGTQSAVWSPSNGYSGGHENSEILASNTDKTRTGSGKSYVVWRDSTTGGDSDFNSDGQIIKEVAPSDELYAVLWCAFDPNWTEEGESGLTKLFRFGAYDGSGTYIKFFTSGNFSALADWKYVWSQYGVRNQISFRADPQETNYKMENPGPGYTPRSFTGGSMSLQFESNIRDWDGDGTDENTIDSLYDLVDGTLLGSNGNVFHENVFGSAWHKMEFYVKMNSAPGSQDGVFKQWMDDQLILNLDELPFMGTDSPGGIKWNTVHIGGNTSFHAYPDADQRQEWFAIDSIDVYDGIPEDR